MREKRASSFQFNVKLYLPYVMRTAVIILVLALIAGGIALAVRSCSSGNQPVTDGGVVIKGASPSSQFYAMKDTVVAFDGSYARAYDTAKGDLLWERSPDGSQGFRCASSTDLIALYKANSICVYDAEGGVAFSTTTDKTIAEVSVGVKSVAIRYQDDSIDVMDSTGKPVETLAADEKGEVLSFGLYSSSDLMWVLRLNAEGIEPECTLNIHQPGKLLIAGYTTSEQLYHRPVMFGDSVYIVGTRTIDVRNTDDMTESEILIYGWTLRDSYAGDNLVILLSLTEQGEQPTSLRTIVNGKATDLRMPAGCTGMALNGDYVCGFAGKTVYAVPVSGGKTASYALPYSVDSVLCRLYENKVLVSAEGQVRMVNLP